jgi:hypothetical protein
MRRYHKYTPDEIQFLKDNIKGRGRKEITELFNRHFGLSIKVEQINHLAIKHKLKSGLTRRHYNHKTRFKPGHKTNCKPIGSERMNRGFIQVKVSNTNDYRKDWKFKHRVIWEKAYGEIPKDHKIIFADGNKLNLSLDNLLLISNKEHIVMNSQNLTSNDLELTKIGHNIAKLSLLISKRKREFENSKCKKRRKKE